MFCDGCRDTNVDQTLTPMCTGTYNHSFFFSIELLHYLNNSLCTRCIDYRIKIAVQGTVIVVVIVCCIKIPHPTPSLLYQKTLKLGTMNEAEMVFMRSV